VDNDTDIGRWAKRRGAGVGDGSKFYVTLGSGRGVSSWAADLPCRCPAAELGHVRLDRNGTTLESRCSGWALDAKIRALAKKEPSSLLAKLVGDKPGAEAKHLTTALNQGDAAARRLLEETASDLAFGLSHVTHLFHPEAIILGGGLSGVGEPLRAAVERSLRGFIMEAFQPGPLIALSVLREDAVPVGALELASLRE
jgi:glucokinase